MIALTLERPTVQTHTHLHSNTNSSHYLTHPDTFARTHTQTLYFVVKLVAKKTVFFFLLFDFTYTNCSKW